MAKRETDRDGNILCQGDVSSGWSSYQCQRKGNHQDPETLKWYCWQHDPTKQKIKENAKDAERAAHYAAQDRKKAKMTALVSGLEERYGIKFRVKVNWQVYPSVVEDQYLISTDDVEKLVKLLAGFEEVGGHDHHA